jgi:alpha-mannosidase
MAKRKTIADLEKELERLKRDYDNLLRGAYMVESGSRNRLYTISIVEWEKCYANHRGGAIICTDLLTAKLVENGLQRIFHDAKITVSTKLDIYNDASPEWKTV